MLRLCSDSSRSYPGRSVRIAVPDVWDCALHGNMQSIGQKSAKAIVGVGRRPLAIGRLETSRGSTPEVLPCRRAELEEGDVLLYELSWHVKPDRVIAHGARHKEFSSPR